MALRNQKEECEFKEIVEGQKIVNVAIGGTYAYIVTENNELYIMNHFVSEYPILFQLPKRDAFYPEILLNEYIKKNKTSVFI